MNLDQRLTDASRAIADGLTAPDIDLTAVRSAARTNRHRIIGVAAVFAVIAAVVAVAVGGALLIGPSPQNPSPEPVERPGDIGRGPVWYDDAGLHHGDLVEQTAVDLIDEDGNTELLALVRHGALYTDSQGDDVWYHPWGGEPRIVGESFWGGPAGDPDGDVAAWFDGDDLVVYDTVLGRELSRTNEDLVDEYHRGLPRGNGFLYVSSQEVVWRVDRTDTVRRLDLTTGTSSELEPIEDYDAGTLVRAAGPPDDGFFLDTPGSGTIPLPALSGPASLSPDGSFLIAEGWNDRDPVVVNARTGDRGRFGRGAWTLPSVDGLSLSTAWSYDGRALVLGTIQNQGDGPLLACDPVRRLCDELPTAGQVLLPVP